ncbi:alpha/beta fold hydrolase [Streptomyces sp. TLI_171]|uniref:alpha/beta fold hydrolase n=1 Tax=Streptomyces sp. TLI_171 TaxID=1938859 RepID=UPI000C17F0C8|nr:alpha/beta hydrolase [Streptomyces sp. TLI_171]RKE23608.1 pimeloyl-ACP methyl ester carboxylesterase [Streptomyces sp. TLI_171]
MIDRRSFSKAFGLGVGAAAVSLTGLQGAATAAPAVGRSGPAPVVPPLVPGTHTSFPALKQVEAGLLDVGYAELGPADAPVVLCLHGWPYDIHSYVDVAPLLADLGYRVIVPYLRGHGTTRFRSPRTFRNAQQSAVALDVIALLDALRIDRAVLAGFDWGSRTADIVAALWPERVKALVSVGGYLITNRAQQLEPIAPAGEHTWWYQYYFATERGRKAMERPALRHDLTRLVWQLVSPTWKFDDATFERTEAAFDNPDYAAIVIHNYRWRLGIADGEHRYDRYEDRLADKPAIGVPTITLDPALDPFTAPGDGSGYRSMFTGRYEHRTLADIGHNLPQEAPTAFAQAVVDADRL